MLEYLTEVRLTKQESSGPTPTIGPDLWHCRSPILFVAKIPVKAPSSGESWKPAGRGSDLADCVNLADFFEFFGTLGLLFYGKCI